MPMVNGFRTTKEDYDRIQDYAHRTGRTLTDVFRTAVLKYIDESEAVEHDEIFARRTKERDREISSALKSIESRFAVLIVRLGIDMESIYALAWSLTEGQPDRRELFEQCYQVGVKRFRRKLKDAERSMVESLLHQGDQLRSPGPSRGSFEEEEEEEEEAPAAPARTGSVQKPTPAAPVRPAAKAAPPAKPASQVKPTVPSKPEAKKIEPSKQSAPAKKKKGKK